LSLSVIQGGLLLAPPRLFSFSSFHPNASNRLAFAAAQAVCRSLATAYNPLVIQAPVGLGKTHLLSAMYAECSASEDPSSLYFLSPENSALWASQELLSDIGSALTPRSVLFIDDLHLLLSNPTTSSLAIDWLHLFLSRQQQIALTSVKPVRSLSLLPERLISRLQWGLVVDIELPPSAARADLLRKKAAEMNLPLSEEMIARLASSLHGCVREMESVLKKIASHVALLSSEITPRLIDEILSQVLRPAHTSVSMSQIALQVASYFHIGSDDLVSPSRVRSISHPRHIAMYLCQRLTHSSLEEIGRFFGGRDHSTVKHGCDRIRILLESDSSLRNSLDSLQQKLFSLPSSS